MVYLTEFRPLLSRHKSRYFTTTTIRDFLLRDYYDTRSIHGLDRQLLTTAILPDTVIRFVSIEVCYFKLCDALQVPPQWPPLTSSMALRPLGCVPAPEPPLRNSVHS